MANAGVYPITVADSFMVELWSRVLKDLRPHPEMALKNGHAYRLGHPARTAPSSRAS